MSDSRSVRQTSVQITKATENQVSDLKPIFGGFTDIVRIAIDRLYQSEVRGMDRRYSVFTGGYVPSGTWQERGDKLMAYKQAAAYAVKVIENEAAGEETTITVWDGAFEVAGRALTGVWHSADYNNPEHVYIARAMQNAIDRKHQLAKE